MKADKGRFTSNVGLLVERFKLHLDDQVRVENLASTVRQTFNFADITAIYKSEFEAHCIQLRQCSMEEARMQSEHENEIAKIQASHAYAHQAQDLMQARIERDGLQEQVDSMRGQIEELNNSNKELIFTRYANGYERKESQRKMVIQKIREKKKKEPEIIP